MQEYKIKSLLKQFSQSLTNNNKESPLSGTTGNTQIKHSTEPFQSRFRINYGSHRNLVKIGIAKNNSGCMMAQSSLTSHQGVLILFEKILKKFDPRLIDLWSSTIIVIIAFTTTVPNQLHQPDNHHRSLCVALKS